MLEAISTSQNTLGFCSSETVLFTSFQLCPPFRSCWYKRMFGNGTTHRLIAWMRGTSAAASEVLERSEKVSKNTEVVSRNYSGSDPGRECLGLVRKGKRPEKKKKKVLQIQA